MTPRDALGGALILAVLAAAGVGFYAAGRLTQARYDPETLCPVQGPSGATVVVIDKTDPLTRAQVDAVRREILSARGALPPGAEIGFAVIEATPGEGTVPVRMTRRLCNPGSEANPLYENPKLVLARYEEAFRAPLDRDLETLVAPGVIAPQSPIAAALSVALAGSAPNPGPRRLILISDLMEHTATASAYDGTVTLAGLRENLGADAAAWLSGAEVRLLVLPRDAHRLRQERARALWIGLFTSLGAAVAETD